MSSKKRSPSSSAFKVPSRKSPKQKRVSFATQWEEILNLKRKIKENYGKIYDLEEKISVLNELEDENKIMDLFAQIAHLKGETKMNELQMMQLVKGSYGIMGKERKNLIQILECLNRDPVQEEWTGEPDDYLIIIKNGNNIAGLPQLNIGELEGVSAGLIIDQYDDIIISCNIDLKTFFKKFGTEEMIEAEIIDKIEDMIADKPNFKISLYRKENDLELPSHLTVQKKISKGFAEITKQEVLDFFMELSNMIKGILNEVNSFYIKNNE